MHFGQMWTLYTQVYRMCIAQVCSSVCISLLPLFTWPRLLKDHTDSSGIQGHALATLKAKLEDAERGLQQEQESHRRTQVKTRLHNFQAPVTVVGEGLATLVWGGTGVKYRRT